MERFFGSLKTERTDKVQHVTHQQAKNGAIDYIEMFYNSFNQHTGIDMYNLEIVSANQTKPRPAPANPTTKIPNQLFESIPWL
jgi:hypothetical protein